MTSASNSVVLEAEGFYVFGRVDVSAVKNNGATKLLLNACPIRSTKLIPFRDDDERVGAVERVVLPRRVIDSVSQGLPGVLQGLRVEDACGCPGVEQFSENGEGGRFPNVVGVWLERKPPNGHSDPFQVVLKSRVDFVK